MTKKHANVAWGFSHAQQNNWFSYLSLNLHTKINIDINKHLHISFSTCISYLFCQNCFIWLLCLFWEASICQLQKNFVNRRLTKKLGISQRERIVSLSEDNDITLTTQLKKIQIWIGIPIFFCYKEFPSISFNKIYKK